MSNQKICTFYVDKFFFGIDVNKIQEVIRYQEMTHVPLTNPVIRGLINMRGQIVTAIDMRRRLIFKDLEEDLKPTIVIVRTDDGAVSLLVDQIGDVIDVPESQFETPPENLDGAISKVLRKVCQFEKNLLLILDVDRVLDIEH